MSPLVRELIAAAIGFLPPAAEMGGRVRQARLSELRRLLCAAEADWADWPEGARELVHQLRAVSRGQIERIPACSIGRACDDHWPAGRSWRGPPPGRRASGAQAGDQVGAELAGRPNWLDRRDCGEGL